MNTWMGAISMACVISLSVFLYLFFDGRQFWFSDLLSNASQDTVVDSSVQTKKTDQTQATNTKPHKKPYRTVEHLDALRHFGLCQTHVGTKVKYRLENGIYTWVDSKGIRNYSDKKPSQGAETYQPRSGRTLDYFELEISGEAISNQFRNKLKTKLKSVFRGYTSILGLSAMRKVKLKIVVLPSRAAYERTVKSFGGDPSGNVGVYFGIRNTALLEQRSYQQTMRTAIHEAVHAINQAVIGFSPRWLNEGLAEYFESIDVSMQVGKVSSFEHVSRKGFLQGQVMSPLQLFGAEAQWRAFKPDILYRSSWAFMHFLMSSDKGRMGLKQLMLLEQSEPCSSLGSDKVLSVFTNHYPALGQTFLSFISRGIKPHRL
ncbi:DUF1570 domain-containing protein [Pseudoalteromonas luteoviolacea]|uniref:DUF1570 domain-containing protein n=1 Tax=Pseudoalteromonas luteoviolacea S4054 TaxID=1129367 RepID=A0A0F6AHH5_9GAMM|nr:DUF1570 domain-containing protein [Pseudoalteromonas luteoviolacea]AOT10443.1 hypothetical protein S4054249_21475 [Pseudoalteromonas luteoviolacea]AOT15487.1 hypothetical protein S40542_22115 [Pseudoalteromonas luteoviolacea]AOT20262.1 hypothetical protein S4054_21390 [Pseudoalteromonas luteoviolacea]KKE85680.1 hypothetical protein N479_25155 [Pseudoalteromonas luteoviolacea S4054]KZN73176.1 hypothetical protein N481_13215 [Pseudoalteromonas luteoviolacea S4047-1]